MSETHPTAKPQPSILAALENMDVEWQALLARFGHDVIMVIFDGKRTSPVWAHQDAAGALAEAIKGHGHQSGVRMLDGFYICFYQVVGLARSLMALKGALQQMGLIDHAQILVAEPEAGWRVYWPATAEII